MNRRMGQLLLVVAAFFWVSTTPVFPAFASSGDIRIVQPHGAAGNVIIAEHDSTHPAVTTENGTADGFENGRWRPALMQGRTGATRLAFNSPAPSSVFLAFNDQFQRKVATHWEARSGDWAIIKNKSGQYDYLSSEGVSGESATIIHDDRFSNFTFTARIARKSSLNNKASRLIFRASGNLETNGHFRNEYSFNIARNGNFSVFKHVDFEVTPLTDPEWQHSDAVKTGKRWNVLRVTAKGPDLSFYINDQLVFEVEDDSLAHGRVGLGFYRHPDSTGDEMLVDWAILKTFAQPPSQPQDSPPEAPAGG